MQDETQITAIHRGSGLLFDPPPPETRDRLIRFPLGDQPSVLLPLKQLTQILNVERHDVLSIPEMPDCVIGICTWHTEMLWLVDLNHFIGASPLLQPSLTRLTILVIQHDRQALGLAVSQVNEIELQDLQRLLPPPIGLFSPGLLPLIQGVLPGSSDAVLNLTSLIDCPLWKKHPKGGA
ncbi:chemotaxis protein CheW [Leptolyngbya sp. AN03gr2]|uniref:chemotaxis protein CheW n=1 Tax=unclassified Leptolyngbya TaxID=2650499 RepID=UPI003D315533